MSKCALTKADKAKKLQELINALYNKELDLRKRKAEVEAAVNTFDKLKFPKNYTVDDLVCSIANKNKNFWFLLGDMRLDEFAYKLFIKQITSAQRETLDYMMGKRQTQTNRSCMLIRSMCDLVTRRLSTR